MDVRTILGREPAMRIGGSWVGTDEGRPVINPANESVIAEGRKTVYLHYDGFGTPAEPHP